VAENKLDAMRGVVVSILRDAGGPVSKGTLRQRARDNYPEQCRDRQRCGCGVHVAKWHHTLDRALFELRNLSPPKVRSVPGRRGWYELCR
jgi:hypothetical protein